MRSFILAVTRASLVVLIAGASVAKANTLGDDAAACQSARGPAIQVNVAGLKDLSGELWLELYPATEADFLRAEEELAAQGKSFRRIRTRPPASAVAMCIRAPRPGQYAVLVRHNRTGRDKFSLFNDGAGLPANFKLGRSRPKVADAIINVGTGVVSTNVTMQYFRGLRGFAPLKD